MKEIRRRDVTGRYLNFNPISCDDYTEEAYASNEVKLNASKYGCKLHNESKDSWATMSSEVTYTTMKKLGIN